MIQLIIFVALALRLPLLNQSLWLDEAIQALALQGKMGPLLSYALADFQPPLYHGLLYLFTSVFGTSELALRTPSLFFGVLTVYFGYKLAKALSNHKVATIAGWLLATNPLLIYYAQEGRTYGLTAMLTVATMYFLVSQKILPYIVFLALTIWSSYLSWFWVLGIFAYLLLTNNYRFLKATIYAGASLIFWLPSLITSLNIGASTLETSQAWGQVVGGISLKALALTWVKFNLGRISFDPDWLYTLIVIALLALHGYIFVMSARPARLGRELLAGRLLLTWLFVPIVLGAIFALFLPVYQYFRLLFVLPAYLLLLALALSYRSKLFAMAIVLAQLIFLGVFWATPRFHREDWRSLVTTYGQDNLYALPSRNQNAPLLYYGVARDNILEPKVDSIPDISQIIYIRYAEELFDSAGLGRGKLLESGYTQRSERAYSGIIIEEYVK